MIEVNPSKRITAIQALDHSWIKNAGGDQKRLDSEEQAKLDKEVVANLKKYRGQSILKKAAMNVLVKHLAPNQINSLKKEFEKMDKDLSGFIEIKELENAIQQADLEFTASEIKDIISELDYDKNEKVNYSEFLAATINASAFLSEEKLAAIFKTFDVDNSGQITAENIQDAFSKFGKEVTDDEVK